MIWTESAHWNFEDNLRLFSQGSGKALLGKGNHGLEREALRVLGDGTLSLRPHPRAIGDKLTHPAITTDFSESQLEFITPPFATLEECYRFLAQIHGFVSQNINGELLWPMSMPCRLPAEADIPIAHYGEGAAGMAKEIYRRGLALRYGKVIQMVCGIHYNFSFSQDFWEFLHGKLPVSHMDLQDFINEGYCAMVRNFLRLRWLFVYLYGASPVVDSSYTTKALEALQLVGTDTYGLPYATSLRMSHFGYSNEEQRNFRVCYNTLERYISDLRRAMSMPDSRYEALGLYRDGQQVQLNANVLQIENEYYAPIRLKNSPEPGETQLESLERSGVRYIEVRASDLNPYNPFGLECDRLYFLHMLLIYCLLRHSDHCSRREREEEINSNERLVALEGRKPGIEIAFCGQKRDMRQAARLFLGDMEKIALLLDEHGEEPKYTRCVLRARERIENSELTLSGMMMAELTQGGTSFVEHGLSLGRLHKMAYDRMEKVTGLWELLARGE
ncbi:glutamate--cysteine ligase [Desulfurispirillum indicum]|uniref:Glutamate--cysteine ligase n=1 Tax=Desulfurispirillum indicum (strain ATCC BAA-1389 / DSM 22839 / S5) TaxID=653733 RepID=E6W0P2_DESIS|nr:glutamate--cysteine ligase [Desulfurispirillum indicum]ADU66387.1 glutamate/cysteine ligase [Desulfurispirillum indicum S5]UCZ55720.1 glutamate--cysteine ligase [Desulfurispirillum indicum]